MLPDDARLTRNALAQALTDAGYPTSPATLATKATRGGGPPFQHYGPRVIYIWGKALRWAQSRLGPVICSTSERPTPTEAEKTGAKRHRLNAVRSLGRRAENVSHGEAVRRGRPSKRAPLPTEANPIA
jgi:hypothetical protein